MSHPSSSFRWDSRRDRAAVLVADDTLSEEKIAAELGMTRRHLYRWRHHPVFIERVTQIAQGYVDALKDRGIAERQNRVDALNDRWRRLQTVIDERAEDMATVPGGSTGLLVRQTKTVGTGPQAQIIDEYAVDTGLLRELRAHEEQAAKELGQWIEKQDTTSGGEPVRFTIAIDRRAHDITTDEEA